MEEIINGFTGFAKKDSGFTMPKNAKTPEGTVVAFTPEELADIDDRDRRWSWVEINLRAIQQNTLTIKHRLRPNTKLMAVVKADAYGHGAVRCAKASLSAGADWLGVSTVNEGIELRQAGINAPILILAEPPMEAIPLLLSYKITPAVFHPEFAIAYGEAADRHGMRAPYHLAVNSGMNRIGVRHDEVLEFMQQVAFHRALDLEGTFTHFATADCEETFDFKIQVRRFTEAINAMKAAGINPGIVHAANSAAIIRYPETHFDMVRLGISLYGFHPCKETRRLIRLHPAMTVKARITEVKTVPMSEGVSYGMHYRSPGSVKICTLPVGYADGYRRGLSGRVHVVLDGRRFPQVGNICMDQCMFEVDLRSQGGLHRVDPRIGDIVTLVGAEGDAFVTIDEQADICGTIQHEIAIGYSLRMPRYWF